MHDGYVLIAIVEEGEVTTLEQQVRQRQLLIWFDEHSSDNGLSYEQLDGATVPHAR